MTTHDKVLTGIASRFLDIPTLEAQNLDSLDFHEICVTNLKQALEAAVQWGQMLGPDDCDVDPMLSQIVWDAKR